MLDIKKKYMDPTLNKRRRLNDGNRSTSENYPPIKNTRIEEMRQMDYEPLETYNTELKEFVDNAFSLIDEDMKKNKDRIIKSVREEMDKMKTLPPRRKVFNESFKIRNHMLICYIKNTSSIKKNGLKYRIATKLPLIEMSKHIPYSYFAPWIFPSLLIFCPTHPCSANLSPTGVVNITGGYSIEQLKDAICYFIDIIIKTSSQLTGYNFVLDDINFKLRMVTNKIGGYRIDTLSMRDLCKQNNIKTSCNPETINKTQIFPFKETLPSLGISVHPAGGVNFSGFKGIYEAELAYEFLERLLWKFLRENMEFQGWGPYLKERKKKERLILTRALAKKKKKIADWEQRINEKIEKNVYEAWKMTANNKKARSFLKKCIEADNKTKAALKKSYKKRPLQFKIAYDRIRSRESYVDKVKEFYKTNENEKRATDRVLTIQTLDFNNYFDVKNSGLLILDNKEGLDEEKEPTIAERIKALNKTTEDISKVNLIF